MESHKFSAFLKGYFKKFNCKFSNSKARFAKNSQKSPYCINYSLYGSRQIYFLSDKPLQPIFQKKKNKILREVKWFVQDYKVDKLNRGGF